MISVDLVRWKLRQLFSWLRYGRSSRFPFGCVVIAPIKFSSRYISMGRGVIIGHAARLEAVTNHNSNKYMPAIHLGDGVTIQQNLHLTCANKIMIGSNTAIAANVTITDIDHPYADATIPIEHQDLAVKDVVIGEDCKIYNNAVILPGVHIGKHCVVGANSVVVRDIPDFSVVAGAPARILKRYDPANRTWIAVKTGI